MKYKIILLLYLGVAMVNAALAVEEVEYNINVPDYIDIEKNLTISNIVSYTDVTDAFDAAPWGLDWGEVHAPYKWKVTTANGELTIAFERYETVSTDSQSITFFRTVTEQTGSHIETRYREVRQPAGIMGIPLPAGIQGTGWWNNAWQYRIDNPIPDGARPYQFSLTISNSVGTNNATHVFLNGHAKADLSDIRFTLNNAIELPYWIENTAAGKVWVKVPDNGTVNIYYGNPSAADSGDGTSTFEFFDDFTSLDFGANPVISPSQPWESGGILRWGTIAYSNGMYYMYYTNGASNTSDIGRANSTDLITWTKNINNPVINDRIGPSLLKELDGTTPVVYDNKYWMLTMKSDGSGIELRSASTLDNDTWKLENSNLIPKVNGTWYVNYLFTTSFVKENGNYYIFMESGKPGVQWKIGYFNASSPRGPFSDRSVLLSPTLPWEGNGVLDPEIRKFGDTYYLFYTANDNLPYQNSYAFSSSLGGIYNKTQIKITPVNQSYPAILQKDQFYYVLTDDQPSKYPGKSLYRRKDLNGPFGSPFIWNRGGSPTVSGSELLINESGEFLRSSSNFLYKAIKIRAKYAPQTAVNSFQYFGFVPSSAASERPSEMFFSRENATNALLEAWSGNYTSSENISIYNQNYFGSYHNYEILWRKGEAKFIIDDALKATQTASVANASLPVGIYDFTTSANLTVDWVFVRNYISPEPAWGVWSTERTSQTGNAPVITGFAPASPVSDIEQATRTFNITVNQVVNVTWYINGTPVKSTEKGVTSAIYANTSAAKGTWVVNATASNANGSVSREWTWTVNAPSASGAPGITGFAPASPINDIVGATRSFNITVNQTVNVTWYINGAPVKSTEKGVINAIYANTSAAKGTWVVNATASNANGSVSREWTWTVNAPSASGAPGITGFAPASPINDIAGATRSFNITVNQTVNVTWYINGTPVKSTEKGVTSAIYANTSAAKGTWIVNATASNANGSASREWTWTVNAPSASGAPGITGFAPASPINDIAGVTRSFNITVNQIVNVTWYINSTPVKSTEKDVTSATYANTSAEPGTWNVTAIASNKNGTNMQIWQWIVTKPLVINIISPVNDSVNPTGYVNVTVTLNKTGTAQYLNWNGINYTMTPNTSQSAGKVFFRNMTGLLSGKYSLKVYANDTTGVSNVSETRVVTVNRTIVDKTIGSFINTTDFIVNKTIEIAAPSGNVTVTIPNGTNASVGGAALTLISIDSLAQVNSTFVANLGSGNILIGENLSLGPEGAQFRPDIQIRFNYTDAQLTAAGITSSSLRIKFYNTTTNTWVEQTPYTPPNITGKYITANVSHFSTFALVGTITPATTSTPPSSGGGGGGGGGGGASGENYNNIELKERYEETIYKDKPTSYRFKNASNPVTFVNITGNVNAGLIDVAAEVLKGTSTLVKENAPGIVYKNINIWVGTSGFASSKNIKEANIMFRVENSWIDGNAFPRNEIKLVKWDSGKWITLETSEKMKDSTYTYFEGKTTNFSSFAITGIKIASSTPAFEVTPTVSTPTASATTTATNTNEKAPAANLYLIIGAIAIIAIIVVVYLKYK